MKINQQLGKGPTDSEMHVIRRPLQTREVTNETNKGIDRGPRAATKNMVNEREAHDSAEAPWPPPTEIVRVPQSVVQLCRGKFNPKHNDEHKHLLCPLVRLQMAPFKGRRGAPQGGF